LDANLHGGDIWRGFNGTRSRLVGSVISAQAETNTSKPSTGKTDEQSPFCCTELMLDIFLLIFPLTIFLISPISINSSIAEIQESRNQLHSLSDRRYTKY